MPEFNYVGTDRDGNKVSGKMDVPSEGELRMILRAQGVRPTQVSKVSLLNADLGLILRGGVRVVPRDILVTMTRQLQVLINSGVPLVQALSILSEQVPDPSTQTIVLSVREKVSSGSFFWEALAAYPQSFSKIYIALIRAGESSGSLDVMLDRLSIYLEKAEKLRKLLKSAMFYPLMVTSIGVSVISIIMIFVIPRFESMIKSMGSQMPPATQALIDTSRYMAANWYWLFGAVFAVIYLLKKYATSNEGREIFDRVAIRLPMFGELIKKAAIARFSRTMSTLLSSGVNIVDAIEVAQSTMNNAVIEGALRDLRASIEEGKTMGMVLSQIDIFPKMAVQMVTVGESTGNLDQMLGKTADFYEDEVETMVSGLSKLIEPIILVVLGGAVGGIMICLYLPLFTMGAGVK